MIPTNIANCEVKPILVHYCPSVLYQKMCPSFIFQSFFFHGCSLPIYCSHFPPKKGHEEKDLLFKSLVSTVPHIKVGVSKSYMIYGLRGDTRYRCGQKGKKSGSMVDPMDS